MQVMINCPECGKELKHKGALNGHLAFAHGIVTPRQLTTDELREEVKKLRSELNHIKRYLNLLNSTGGLTERTHQPTAHRSFPICRASLGKK